MNAKPLFILVMFVLLIVLFAGGAIGSTDLTPDTPPAEVVGISAAAAPAGSAGLLYSPCGVSYEVRAGDTLFQISQACGISVADILAANPTIQDPNLISPGQQLAIPGSAAAASEALAVAAPQEVAASEALAVAAATEAVAEAAAEVGGDYGPDSAAGEPAATEPAAEGQPAADVQPAAAPDLLPQGLVPGGIIHVTVKSLAATTPVSLGIGREGETPNMVEDRITNEKGELIIHMAIPHTAKSGERWTVSVMTMTKPKTLVQSVPFTIE